MAKKSSNVRNATIIGTSVGAAATPAIAWGAAVLEVKTGIPAAVTMPALGALAGLFMRWAAKLNPHD
jgi:hypothetical protein